MARVRDLLPGDLVTLAGESAVFILAGPHPRYDGLQLVLWWLLHPGRDSTWSLDALRPDQEVGDVTPADKVTRWTRVQEAFRA